jgi:formyltetrahydrofolate-dependent phosphoribosylglycinamide formyltransferase
MGVLISGGGRSLMNLHRLIQAGQLDAQIAVVVASRRCKGEELARQAGLGVHVVSYKKSKAPADYSGQITGLLSAGGVELVVMAGFLSMWVIPPQFLGRVINIHPALLPSFGGQGMYGIRVHQAVLEAGCKITGCTVHFVTNEYDRGPIIVQRAVPVLEGDTPESLADRVFQQECIALPEAAALYAAGRLRVEGNRVCILEIGR